MITHTSKNSDKLLGRDGEDFGARFLESRGHTLLARNWRGRYGELDLVSKDGDTLVFTEVKTRRGQKYGTPQSAVTPAKQKKLCRAALEFITAGGYGDCNVRFDVLALIRGKDGFQPAWFVNAFEFDAGPGWY